MTCVALGVGLALSAHVGLVGDYNEIHPHLRASCGQAIAGAYYNSEDAWSAYAGYRFEHERAFLEVGAVTGYTGLDVSPFLRAGVAVADHIEVFATPAYETATGRFGAVVGVEIRFGLAPKERR